MSFGTPATYAEIGASRRGLGYAPTPPVEVGIPRSDAWYKAYHGVA